MKYLKKIFENYDDFNAIKNYISEFCDAWHNTHKI